MLFLTYYVFLIRSQCTFAFWCTMYMNPIREIENNGSGNEIISFDWVTMEDVSSLTLKRC